MKRYLLPVALVLSVALPAWAAPTIPELLQQVEALDA